MRIIDHDGRELATESFGNAADPALLLIMGATASMLGWPDEFCEELAGRGLFVIRFDHRDTGRSTTAPSGGATYSVEDMADDCMAILDGYGRRVANLVGMSLGGYIAQMLALTNPDRVSTLTLIGSEPLGWDGAALPHISQAFMAHFTALSTLDWLDREAVGRFLLRIEQLCAGSGAPFDEGREKARIARIMDRAKNLPRMFNHSMATTRADWTGRFREIKSPVLVIHGEEDPVLTLENGKALAEGINGAKFFVLTGVGHEIPARVIPEIVEKIAVHVKGA